MGIKATYWDIFDEQGRFLGRAATTDAEDAVDLARHTHWGQTARSARRFIEGGCVF